MALVNTSVEIDRIQLNHLYIRLRTTPKLINRQLHIAISRTVQYLKSQMAKPIQREVKLPQRVIKENIRAEGPKLRGDRSVSAAVRLRKSDRISLKEFGARQMGLKTPLPKAVWDATYRDARGRFLKHDFNPLAGVSYQISQQGGRKFVPAAFMPQAQGGHVFKRVGGAGRLPITKLWGVSPFGVFVKRNMLPDLAQLASARLYKEIDDRIRIADLFTRGQIGIHVLKGVRAPAPAAAGGGG